VLVTHGPPWGILDFCGSHAGCSDLLDIVTKKLSAAPRFHIFGHIHEGFGRQENEKTQFLNVSVCDQHYRAVNKPTVFEV
jgi:Icc-related predicted phosphoesterase